MGHCKCTLGSTVVYVSHVIYSVDSRIKVSVHYLPLLLMSHMYSKESWVNGSIHLLPLLCMFNISCARRIHRSRD